MALESATYVSGLVQANPPGTDPISQGDDHIRLLKKVLLNSFPNADAALNAIHTKATAPSSTSAGLIWFDTTDNVLKVRDETNASWITLPISPVTDFKILGANGVGWVLPTADGIADQYLKTDAAGNLDWATVGTGNFKGIGHSIIAASGNMRDSTMTDATNWTITYNKQSATSDLYVSAYIFMDAASSFDSTSAMTGFVRLANDSGVIIANTTDNIQAVDFTNPGSGESLDTVAQSFSRTWKVASADCPDGTTGNNEFRIQQYISTVGDNLWNWINGIFMVMEIE